MSNDALLFFFIAFLISSDLRVVEWITSRNEKSENQSRYISIQANILGKSMNQSPSPG